MFRNASRTFAGTDPGPRPLTGSEMEEAARREKLRARVKAIERIAGLVALAAASFAAFGNVGQSVKNACAFAVVAAAILGLVVRRGASSRS
jgi:hypothetical protein